MNVVHIILVVVGILFFAGGLWLLFKRPVVAPVGSLAGLSCIYFSRALPLAPNMVMTWLALTLIVMLISLMQPQAVMQQRRGTGYMLAGALAGMMVGLISLGSTTSLTAQYACMIVGIVAGIFFGFMLFACTPQGVNVGMGSGKFFNYLAAKGFPVAITVIQPGVAILLWLVTHY